ncbi:MAG: PhzF family phenazine biosynthesis protein [Steroidobacteraceae bacterium]
MKPHAYRLVNVFTHGNDRFSGNPLCVFEDGAGLSDEAMQALARQFNLSETTFILPPAAESPAPEDPAAAALVRIFTPSYEMPFAGHPTLGTAQVCRALGLGEDELRLRMLAGTIPVSAKGNRWTLTAPTSTAREVDESRADLAAGLGLDEADIGERPLWVDSGSEQLIVPLASESAVRQAVPNREALRKFQNRAGNSMAYVFHVGKGGKALARFFFDQGTAMLEDPATGSATANFGGWWVAMAKPLPCSLAISQGQYAQRPSTLYLDVSAERRVTVSGEVMDVGRGVFEV